jgi:YggT family protein
LTALVFLIVSFVHVIIGVLQLLMMIRAIFSWLPSWEDTGIFRFVILVTEPIIIPIRKLLSRSSFLSGLPIDISFLIAWLLLNGISYLLPPVIF